MLLIGVPHSNNASLHLAESRAEWPGKQRIVQGSAVAIDGLRCWVTYEECDIDTDDFDQVGNAFNRTGLERSGPIGDASAKLMPQRALVDFASAWFTANRQHPKG